MNKLIALIALLAAAAWAISATASWISKKRAPRALGPGKTSRPVTAAEQDKAMVVGHFRTVTAVLFAVIMFAGLFRVSIGISGQAGLTIVLIASLSTSGGLLLFSALPAKKFASHHNPAQNGSAVSEAVAQRLKLRLRQFWLPSIVLLSFVAFIVTTGVAGEDYLPWQYGVPALLAALALAGSSFLALRRLAAATALPDPRMPALDRTWRQLSVSNLLTFTTGAMLASFGGTAMAAAFAILARPRTALGAAAPTPTGQDTATLWATIVAAGGAALVLAGVVLLLMAVKGAFTLRARVRKTMTTPSPERATA